MKAGLLGDNVGLFSIQHQEALEMLYAGLDLSRQRLDVHVLAEDGRTVEVTAVRPDADALRTLARYVLRHGQEVPATIESMTGARFVHDQLELAGWDVEIADAQKVKGLAPLAAKTDKIDAWVPPSSGGVTSCRPSGCPIQPSEPNVNGPASGSISSATRRP
jgi:hypothetical protein